MRYFIRNMTLFIRGRFTAASTGLNGGVRKVSTIFNRTVADDFDHTDPCRQMDHLIAGEGFSGDYFSLLTAVDINNLCVLQYDFITAFITAGVTNPNPDPRGPNTINIIIYSREGLSGGALLETIITATGAKADALFRMGYTFTGTTTDEVIVASDADEVQHIYAGTLTEPGKRVYEAVRFGVQKALQQTDEGSAYGRPSFFIFSRHGGTPGWVEWIPEDCPYYPCHFEGQCCNFCYCPYYPCEDEELGEWMESSSGGLVWNCSSCILLHIPDVATHLIRNPEASLTELKAVRERLRSDE